MLGGGGATVRVGLLSEVVADARKATAGQAGGRVSAGSHDGASQRQKMLVGGVLSFAAALQGRQSEASRNRIRWPPYDATAAAS
eukprot:SAG11_NODE_340_length_10476_cov_6.009155_8_plen_84_part_00